MSLVPPGVPIEVDHKVWMIRQISSQIAERLATAKRTPTAALMLAQLRQRRADLLKTLPPLKVVAGTASGQP